MGLGLVSPLVDEQWLNAVDTLCSEIKERAKNAKAEKASKKAAEGKTKVRRTFLSRGIAPVS